MRKFVAIALLLSLGAAGIFWYAGDSLAFKPEPGDTRLFILEQSTELQLPGVFQREPTRIRMESLLRSDVLAINDGVVKLQSRALHAQLWEQDRLSLDTEQIPEHNDRLQAVAALMKAGVVEQVTSDGRVLEMAYVNDAALAEIKEGSGLPGPILDVLQRDLSFMNTYQPTFPLGRPRVGLSWQTPARDMGGLELPAVQFEVNQVDEESVHLKFWSIGEGASAGADAVAFKIKGFMELERQTGWPRRAAASFSGFFEHGGERLSVQNTMTLTQANIEPRFDADHAWFRAFSAFDSWAVDTADSEFATNFLPPFGAATPEESFEQLEKTLLWFGTNEVDGQVGLDFQAKYFHFATVEFGPASAVRLLNSKGEPVVDPVPLDPRYVLHSSSNINRRKVPFVASQLTSGQLDAIDSVEVDAKVTVPGELHSLVLTPAAPSQMIESLGLTVWVDDWRSDELQVRVHEHGGSLPTVDPLIGVYPLDADQDFLPMFTLRMTHTVLEPFRRDFLESSRGGNDQNEAMQFASLATDQLLMMPMEERYGDWIFELKAEGHQAIESVQVHLYDRKTEQRTFVAPSSLPTLKGGPVVGERTLSEYQYPVLEFASLELDDVTLEGVQQNWLNVVVPADSSGRCDISVVGEPSYQGSPVGFSPSHSSEISQLMPTYGTYNYPPERELVTAHGLTYFYDIEVNVEVDCITNVVVRTGPVPDDGQLTKVGASTLRLSKLQHQTLSQIRQRFNLNVLPLIAYNREGRVLKPLSPAYSENRVEEGEEANGIDLNFWGEIAKVRYAIRMEREARKVSVQFPPLP